MALTLTPALVRADQWNDSNHAWQGHDKKQQDRGYDHDWRSTHAQNAHVQRESVRSRGPAYRWHRDHYVVVNHPVIIHTLPPTHTTVIVHNRTYIVNEGHFYERHPHGWLMVAAPLGWISATLPLGAVTLHIGGIPYFFADGIYYRHRVDGYVVVSVPQPVSDSPESQVVTQIDLLNVRSGPGENFPVTETVTDNTTLDVYGSAPGWYYVRLQDGSYGWVMVRYTSGTGAAG
jgi:hypothetical protein